MCGVAALGFGADGVFRHVDAPHVRSRADKFDGSGDLAFSSSVDFCAQDQCRTAKVQNHGPNSTGADIERFVMDNALLERITNVNLAAMYHSHRCWLCGTAWRLKYRQGRVPKITTVITVLKCFAECRLRDVK